MTKKSLSDVWTDIVTFNDEYFPRWRDEELIYWTNALAGEAGELCNDSKHLRGGGTHRVTPTKKKMRKEMTDVFIYLVLMAESEGIPLEDFIKEVIHTQKLNIQRMKRRM
jgi:NTP pyrophosphatase (non-canonical NTP hydrolase)